MNFRRRRRTERRDVINLVPLIDILFIVLVFLILTATFREMTELRVNLPEAETGELIRRDDQDRLEIVLDAAGQLHVAERQVTLDELAELLGRVPNREAAHILLAADEAVPHGFVVDVMDLIRRLRIERLSIETVREARR